MSSYLCWLCLSLPLGVFVGGLYLMSSFVLVVFVFTSSLFVGGGSCLICVGCVCLYL